MRINHLHFQYDFNDNKTLDSYANVVYDYFDVKQIEEFVASKGAYEIVCLLENMMMHFTNLKILPYLNITMKLWI